MGNTSAVGWAYAWRIITLIISIIVLVYNSWNYWNGESVESWIICGFMGTLTTILSIIGYQESTDEERKKFAMDSTHLGLTFYYIMGIIMIIYVISKLKDSGFSGLVENVGNRTSSAMETVGRKAKSVKNASTSGFDTLRSKFDKIKNSPKTD